METWERVREALRALDFALVPGSGKEMYEGNVRVGTVSVGLRIEVSDLDFLTLPKIWVTNRKELPARLSAHMSAGDQLCYAEKSTFLLDRYEADRSILSCIEQAKSTLSTLLHGNPSSEFMAELAAYWSTTNYLLVDDQTNLTRCTFGVCKFKDNPQILVAGASKARLGTWSKAAGGTLEEFFSAKVVHAVDAIRPPPAGQLALKEALDWLEPQVHSTSSLLDLILQSDSIRPALVVVASNAIIGLEAKATPLIKAAKAKGFRSKTIPALWRKEASRVTFDTFHCTPSSHGEIIARNLNDAAPLSGKKVALIGCGTIGGYLARSLVQIGAGNDESFLCVDNDILKPENIGRHILGSRYLWTAKSEALVKCLKSDFPDVKATFVAGPAQSSFDRLKGFDLVIDATGDEQFSNALNAFALEANPRERPFPPVLFSMIFGNGLAAQSYLARWQANTGCFKCLRPRFHDDWRFSPIKASTKSLKTAIRPCSLGSYIPFAVSASLQAAAIATTQICDYFSDQYSGDLRTVQIDTESTVAIPNKRVSPSHHCPACANSPIRT